MKNFMKWWLPVVLWMGVIFGGSSIGSLPRIGGTTSDAIVHRTAHVLEFAILGALTLRALSKERPITRRAVVSLLIIIALYGASDELHQRFTPGRSSEGVAVLFDVAGGLIGAGVYGWWQRRRVSVKLPRSDRASQRIDEPR